MGAGASEPAADDVQMSSGQISSFLIFIIIVSVMIISLVLLIFSL